MATKKLNVTYDADLVYLNKGYVCCDTIIEQKSLKDLNKTAQRIIKKEYKHEYKNGTRFFLRNIERLEIRLIDTAAKEIKIKI